MGLAPGCRVAVLVSNQAVQLTRRMSSAWSAGDVDATPTSVSGSVSKSPRGRCLERAPGSESGGVVGTLAEHVDGYFDHAFEQPIDIPIATLGEIQCDEARPHVPPKPFLLGPRVPGR